MHGRNVFPDRAEEWDQVLVSSLESLYHRYLVPYVPDEGTLTGHVRPDAADGTSPIVNHKILELATFLHIESISKLSLAPKSDSFRPTLQAEHPEICPASKYGIRNRLQRPTGQCTAQFSPTAPTLTGWPKSPRGGV
jgi:hypothetical protein